MAKFHVTGPDGQKYRATAPDDATEEQVIAYAQQNMGKQSAMGGSPNALQGTAGKSGPRAGSVISTLQGPLMNLADEGLVAVQGGIDRVSRASRSTPRASSGGTTTAARPKALRRTILSCSSAASRRGHGDGRRGCRAWASDGKRGPCPTTAAGRIGTAALAGAGAGCVGRRRKRGKTRRCPGRGGERRYAWRHHGRHVECCWAGRRGCRAQHHRTRGQPANRARQAARYRVGGTFARSVANTADDLAMQRVATAMQRDGMTADQVAARLRTLGPDTPLAVGAGKNTRDLLDTMATMPGRTADAVERAIRVNSRPARRLTRSGARCSGRTARD